MTRALTVRDLLAFLDGPASFALIDVREKGEYNLGQIESASPVPLGDLEWRIGELVPNYKAPIVLYCSDGRRSEIAADTLVKLGYQDVTYLGGGLVAWQSAGQPTHYGWGVRGKDYGEKVAVTEKIPQITPEEMVARQEKGERFVVLDSRTPSEYEQGHLPGACSVPGGQLPFEAMDLIGDKDPTVVVNCAGRTRSLLGAHLLRRMGIPKVAALQNGTLAWQEAGYALERGPDPRPSHPPSLLARERAEKFAQCVASEDRISSLLPAELLALQQSGALHYLIDVRLPREYATGHIPGAMLCPAGQLQFFSEELIGIRTAPIIMGCDGRVRGILSASLYHRMGLPNVSFLEGGVTAWTQAGLPLDIGVPQRPIGRPTRRVPGLAEAQAQVTLLAPFALKYRLYRADAPLILDVRGSGDYALGHLPGARWLSRSYLELRISKLAPNKERPLVTVCDDGVRSVLAAARLQDLGYRKVEVLAGGLPAWAAAAYPLEEGLADAPVSLEVARWDLVDPFQRRNALAFTSEEVKQLMAWETALGDKYER